MLILEDMVDGGWNTELEWGNVSKSSHDVAMLMSAS